MAIYHNYVFLTTNERELLKNSSTDPKIKKARGNLKYRIRQKIKKRMIELAEINNTLREFPETRDALKLDDEVVSSVFELIENKLRYLNYVPIKRGTAGGACVIRSKPKPTRSTESSTEFKVTLEAPTKTDFKRETVIKEHIRELHRLGFINRNLINEFQWLSDDTELSLIEPSGGILNVGRGDRKRSV
jgi:hypothetical protein